jgi:hypothetical protein
MKLAGSLGRLPLLASLVALAACSKTEHATPAGMDTPGADAAVAATASAAAASTPAPTNFTYGELDRATFNRLALRRNLPLFWASDANGDKIVQPGEVRALLFYPTEGQWTANGAFTDAFNVAYGQLVAARTQGLAESATVGAVPADPAERARRDAVVRDLDDAAASLVLTDATKFSAEERTFVDRMLAVAKKIDALYATTKGLPVLQAKLPDGDLASASAFRRNWGPKCVTPTMEKDPACTAIPGNPTPEVAVYPTSADDGPTAQTGDFCARIEARPDAKGLLGPFTVMNDKGKMPVAVNYAIAFKDQMGPIAADLQIAADGITDPAEAALKAYLAAASQSFTSGNWDPADEAWTGMNATNSRWYVRVAPDETYWEPCNHKAGFHLTFARINQGSLAWQAKLKPVQQDMENALARSIGAPYASRSVTFHLPDFIDIVLNAGDDRNPVGATIGESLPNWGPLVAAGRGRTVAMSNLYTDPDSLKIRRAKAESLFTKESLALYADDAQPGLLSTILHEATHNLGPGGEYAVGGKKDKDSFGGELASMLEELKAQTGALYFIEMLRKRGVLSDEEAKKGYVDSMVWALNHVSRGMYTGAGKGKPYSQLSAIQVGFLMQQGALRWDAKATAANGTDKGAYVIDFAKFPAAVDKMMVAVGGIKAKGDKAGADALKKAYVDGTVVPLKTIAERSLKYPQPNFVYALDR